MRASIDFGVLVTILGLIAASCGDPEPGGAGCVPGARLCDGQAVLLCHPDKLQLELERICPVATTCAGGECVGTPRSAPDADGPGPDESAPADDGPPADEGTAVPDDGAAPEDHGTAPPDDGAPPEDEGGEPIDIPVDVHSPADAAKPCGNGAIDPGESCDPSAGAPCPTMCPPQVECSAWLFEGSGDECNAKCTPTTIADAASGDGCCPDGATADEDDDCEPPSPCGNGKLDLGETCDPSAGAPCLEECPGPVGCDGWKLVGVAAECTAECVAAAVTEAVDGDGCCPEGATSALDSDCGPVDCSDPSKCQLGYEKVPNILIVGDVHRVQWHPSGDFALLAGPGGTLYRYLPDGGKLATDVSVSGTIADMDASADGSLFVAVGQNKAGEGRLWPIEVAEDGTLSPGVEEVIANGEPRAVVRNPAGSDFVVASGAKSYINYLMRWRIPDGIFKTKGYNGSGVRDVMWAHPSIYAGSAAVITADGVNGAGSQSWVIDTDLVVANGWSAGFGNPGGAGWRPGGTYGVFTAWTTNKLYVFDGTWQKPTLPGVGTAASPNAIGWKPDGSRALIVGRVIGPSLKAVVIDHRPVGDNFNASHLYDASITGFGDAPWNGTTSVHLLDVQWRPGACGEGLIVGSDTGTSWSPTFGTVIRFFLTDGC